MEEIRSWAGLAAVLISVGTVIWSWLTSGSNKALKEVGELRSKLDELGKRFADDRSKQGEAVLGRFQLVESRLLKIESDLTHLPDREQTHRLELAVERLTGRMETLDERLKPVAAVSDRLQEFLLEQAARK